MPHAKAITERESVRIPLAVLIIITAGCLIAPPARPGELCPLNRSENPHDLSLGLDYFKGYLSDAGAIVASPLSWRGEEWLKFSAVVAVTFVISSEEDDVQSWVQKSRNDDTDMVAQYTGPAGSGKYVLPALVGLYGYGRIAGRDRAERTALLGMESVILSGFFTNAVKYLTHKHRPGHAYGNDVSWNGPGLSHADLSFPSGHSTCSFAVATVVALEYGDNSLVPPLAYCAATLAALSRVNDNAHWMSDIILGSAIGHFTARAIVSRHGGGPASRVSLVPAARSGGMSLALCLEF